MLSTLNRTNVGIDAHSPHHPHLHGDMLILSWYEAGVQIFNIADPTNPIRTGSYDTFTGTSTSYNGNWGNFVQLNSEGILQNVFLSDRTKGLDGRRRLATPRRPATSIRTTIVDGADFLAWQRNAGVTSNATLAMGDGNRDKKVGSPDLDVWKFQFGESGAHHAITAVPEASSFWLAGGALLRDRRAVRPLLAAPPSAKKAACGRHLQRPISGHHHKPLWCASGFEGRRPLPQAFRRSPRVRCEG